MRPPGCFVFMVARGAITNKHHYVMFVYLVAILAVLATMKLSEVALFSVQGHYP